MACVFYLALTVLMMWPLAPNIAKSVIGYPGDNFYFVWVVSWFQQALLQLQISPFFDPFLNYPEGYYLAYNEITSAIEALGLRRLGVFEGQNVYALDGQ